MKIKVTKEEMFKIVKLFSGSIEDSFRDDYFAPPESIEECRFTRDEDKITMEFYGKEWSVHNPKMNFIKDVCLTKATLKLSPIIESTVMCELKIQIGENSIQKLVPIEHLFRLTNHHRTND